IGSLILSIGEVKLARISRGGAMVVRRSTDCRFELGFYNRSAISDGNNELPRRSKKIKDASDDHAMVTKNILIALEQKLYAFQELKMGHPLYSQALVVREKYPSVQFMSGTVIEDAETAKNIQILGGLLQLYGDHEVGRVTSNLQQRKFYKGWKFKYKPLNLQRKHDSRDLLQLILGDSIYKLKHKGRMKHLQPVSDSVLDRRMIEQIHQGHLQCFLEQRLRRGLKVVSMLRELGIGCAITVSLKKKQSKNWWLKYKLHTLLRDDHVSVGYTRAVLSCSVFDSVQHCSVHELGHMRSLLWRTMQRVIVMMLSGDVVKKVLVLHYLVLHDVIQLDEVMFRFDTSVVWVWLAILQHHERRDFVCVIRGEDDTLQSLEYGGLSAYFFSKITTQFCSVYLSHYCAYILWSYWSVHEGNIGALKIQVAVPADRAGYKGRSEITGSSMDLSDVPGVWESRSVDFIVFRKVCSYKLEE
ncbi:hypothetical protein IGI04_023567, partial [Brassica rapa subsp. trilocularis]